MNVQSYRDLIAWQKSMDLALMVYRASATFPNEERYGLTSQMRRAAVSIPCNMAEGQARQSTKDFIHFLSIAAGSLAELETQLILAERLGYLTTARVGPLLELSSEVGRIANGLIRSLQAKLTNS